MCIQYDNMVEVQKYLPKVEEHLSIKYYVKAKLFNDAAQIAFQRKDTEALHYIQSRCASNRETVDKINGLIARLANPTEGQSKRWSILFFSIFSILKIKLFQIKLIFFLNCLFIEIICYYCKLI